MSNVAETIAAQIGNRAFVMMGAKDILTDGNSLQFKVGGNAKKVTAIRVTLDPSDTYTVETYKGRGLKMAKAAELSGIYCDGLHRGIESLTGLYLSL